MKPHEPDRRLDPTRSPSAVGGRGVLGSRRRLWLPACAWVFLYYVLFLMVQSRSYGLVNTRLLDRFRAAHNFTPLAGSVSLASRPARRPT
ncbi:MAG: hypothetical protein WKH64_04015 [Chloroflexia bacterium]